MKILELKVEGYRSLKHVTWKPGDLNIMIGPNGGGKSNLLRLLQLLSAAASGRLARQVQGEGGMVPMLWDGKGQSNKAGGISLYLQSGQFADKENPEYKYEFTFEQVGTSGGGYSVHTEDLDGRPVAETGESPGMKRVLQRHFRTAKLLDPEKDALVEIPGEEISDTESLLAGIAGPLSRAPDARPFQADVAAWGVYPEFDTGREAPARRGIVSRTERRLEPDGANLISVLHTLYETSREFQQDIDEGMRAAFAGEFEELLFPPEASQRIELRVRWKSLNRPQSAADLSDGTLRFLRALTILANPERPSLIAIDEPEIGLHPVMQQIVAEYAVEASRHSQVVLTTHSPEFLDAFDEVLPTTTVVESHEGRTTLKNLSGDALRQWLKSFTLGEILRTGATGTIEEEKA